MTLFAAVTVLAVLAQSGTIVWPWQISWLLDALWEILNFAVLAAIAIICAPSDTSRLLSYASQLPTSDPGAQLKNKNYLMLDTL
jgi:hypothetical protein